MKTTSLLAIHLLTGAASHTAAFAPPSSKASFPSCPAASSSVFATLSAKSKATCAIHSSTSTTTRLYSSTDDESGPEPLATEGDWTAYLDDENTGYIYYFNGVTGESRWEKPTASFPDVDVESAKRKVEREKRRVERRERRERRAAGGGSAEETGAVEANASGAGDASGGGGFFGLFGGGGGGGKATEAEASKVNIREVVGNNEDFLGDIDDVIAEAEEAIKIAEEVEQQQSVKKTFFSAFGFGGGKDKAAEAEEKIARLEAKAKEIEQRVETKQQKQATGGGFFSSFGFGGEKAEPEKEVVEEIVEETTLDGDNIWVEGLKNLFSRTTQSFAPPKMSSTPATTDTTPKTVMPKKEEPASKASVSESDFLDVVWGAETSARPTLNIAEMMKSFQVQTKEPIEVEKAPTVEKFRTVTLDASLQIKPHPEKVSWGGEDAAFSNGRTFGVFDGVSGAEKVKGKKLYSVSLAESMKKKCGKGGLSVVDITNYMNEAKEFADSEGTGASTAVVASIGEDNMLRALNLGDSVCLVLRDGTVAARTREIIHYFDCPYQLGEDSPDRPKDGTTLQTEIYPGDIIVAGSDGVFDNLSDADVCEIVESCPPKAKSAVIAKKIVDRSRAVSLDKSAVTPYSTVARGRSGYDAYKSGRGGKVDDISCIVVKAS